MISAKRITFIALILCAIGIVAYMLIPRSSLNTGLESAGSNYEFIKFDILSEWNDDYRLHVMYPVTPNETINKNVQSEIDTYVDSFKEQIDGKKPLNRPFDLNINADVDFATNDVVHLVFDGKQYIETEQELEVTRLYYIESGNEITTEELFLGDDYLAVLSAKTADRLPEILGDYFDEALVRKGTEPSVENFDEYELDTSDDYVVIFEPGQVAKPEIGIVKVPLQSEELNELFSDSAKLIFANLDEKTVSESHAASQADVVPAPQNVSPQKNSGNTNCTVVKCVAISFDDGPGSPTGELLDLLKQYNVKASFFYIGRQVPGLSANVKRAYEEGHDIGNHTWDHIDMAHTDSAEVLNQLQKTNNAIAKATGINSVLVRPPYGSFTQENVVDSGFSFILWDVDPNDWKDKDADTIYKRVMKDVKGGSVVLSHDIYGSTLEAYRRIIPELISDGYSLVTVSDMFDIDSSNPPEKAFYSL